MEVNLDHQQQEFQGELTTFLSQLSWLNSMTPNQLLLLRLDQQESEKAHPDVEMFHDDELNNAQHQFV